MNRDIEARYVSPPQIVEKGFQVVEEYVDARGVKRLRAISRRFHARQAADDFAALATKLGRVCYVRVCRGVER